MGKLCLWKSKLKKKKINIGENWFLPRKYSFLENKEGRIKGRYSVGILRPASLFQFCLSCFTSFYNGNDIPPFPRLNILLFNILHPSHSLLSSSFVMSFILICFGFVLSFSFLLSEHYLNFFLYINFYFRTVLDL